ncbi:O-acetylhomoserine aminocarboxypropyltransferase/cysteine synthase family protein [Leucobacter sp. M11]|uniref:O-acetylhomoserine aminocarboxypropyltransferase/cysteine synthase family protein n=1 Tax=Leucobacter sp. M11 TaxID=2993565 RepID=UPI002D7FCD8B|nr:PLP-dependent transferase [Leucobacter sp. M11]MEB4613196.1 PLP-dependent transferase [Leucobacter sp. M11]
MSEHDCPSERHSAHAEPQQAGYGFNTRQIHAGERVNPAAGERIAPIALTAGYRFDSFADARDRFAGEADGLVYSRSRNPSTAFAERRIANLEGGVEAITVSSGQAAITAALLTVVQAGERFVSTASIYSGTRTLFGRTFARFGIGVDYVWDPTDDAAWDAAIGPDTRAIYTETIPNPLCDLVDIEHLARVAERHRLPLIVDNTIGTPYLIRPAELGAHVVVHSATKFLSGHGAAVSGVIVDAGTFDWAGAAHEYPLITRGPRPGAPSLLDRFPATAYARAAREQVVNDIGPALSPLNAFLLHQGVETLSLRMDRHVANARAIAEWLSGHPAIDGVAYAGLPDSPHYGLAQRRYPGGPGSVFAATVRGGAAGAARFLDGLRLISHMTGIGDVRSMALHPGTTTHLGFSEELRLRLGITPGLIRLSIGTEDAADLIADLDRALSAC